MPSRDVLHDVAPSPTTARLLLLVSALRKESMVAHQLLQSYRLLLGTTRNVMVRRLPLRTTKRRLLNTTDKAAMETMVAELDRLERLYSPHMVPTEGDERVRGSLCAEEAVPRLGQGRDCTQGSLHTAEVELPRLGQGGGHTNGSNYPSVDWDNVARLSMSIGGFGLTMPRSEALPVYACDPGPDHPCNQTYNPVACGGRYTPPPAHATREQFGYIEGFRTNLGPVSFPRGPVKGYIWDREHSWVIHACPPGQRRRGSRGSRR